MLSARIAASALGNRAENLARRLAQSRAAKLRRAKAERWRDARLLWPLFGKDR